MVLSDRINFIRKIAFYLFLFSFFSLIGSLWLQNTLATFNFKIEINNEVLKNVPGYTYSGQIICSENLQDCRKDYLNKVKYSKKLGECFENEIKTTFLVDDKIFQNTIQPTFINDDLKKGNLKKEYIGKNYIINIEVLDIKKETCIKNSFHYNFYKIIPFYYEFIFKLKNNPKTNLGSDTSINPFIYGETSISNIVKRFPINYVFKPLLFISVILMYLYWKNYNLLFKEILKSEKNLFVFFGIGSAIFLFFHVLFLGMEIDNKIFQTLRKLIIALFILFEIIAQFILATKLFKNRESLNKYCNILLIKIKLYFVILVSLVSAAIIVILLTSNLTSKIDYILEWNYFAILLFYYYFSFLMWKKNISF